MQLEKPATDGDRWSPFRLKEGAAGPSWYRMGTLTILWLECGMCAASRSAASCLFHLFLRFWNQILTCVSVRWRDTARPALSELLRYRFRSKVDSSWNTWLRLNTVRVFFFRVAEDASQPVCASSLSSVRWLSAVFRSGSSLPSVSGSDTAGEHRSPVDTEQWSSGLVLSLGPGGKNTFRNISMPVFPSPLNVSGTVGDPQGAGWENTCPMSPLYSLCVVSNALKLRAAPPRYHWRGESPDRAAEPPAAGGELSSAGCALWTRPPEPVSAPRLPSSPLRPFPRRFSMKNDDALDEGSLSLGAVIRCGGHGRRRDGDVLLGLPAGSQGRRGHTEPAAR
ncbi:hypothetical protein EYF80_045777 [Liparis tanakae]|uniref:Uncharacterized protein n=1 Tax=Liparis tanakae TaxID=230148 RepID=A0A4Z2FUI8_9TELE|nr:hypothetical protein EYF80_045777 [Liparis tanakae]